MIKFYPFNSSIFQLQIIFSNLYCFEVFNSQGYKSNFKPIESNSFYEIPEVKMKESAHRSQQSTATNIFQSTSADSSGSPVVVSGLKISLSKAMPQNLIASEHRNEMIHILGAGGVFDKVFSQPSDAKDSRGDEIPILPSSETSIFDNFDEKRAKLEQIDFESEKIRESKCQTIYRIIDSIPTSADELFKMQIKWHRLTPEIIESSIYPWLVKKISEYLGEPEKVLLEFICEKLRMQVDPKELIRSLAEVLDESEAVAFTANLWRLIVYTLKAQKYSLL